MYAPLAPPPLAVRSADKPGSGSRSDGQRPWHATHPRTLENLWRLGWTQATRHGSRQRPTTRSQVLGLRGWQRRSGTFGADVQKARILAGSGHRIASAEACVGVEMERENDGDVGRMVERLTVTVEEAAAMLGISRTTAYGCASRNEIPTVRLGRRVVVPTAALMTMLRIDEQPPGENKEVNDGEAA